MNKIIITLVVAAALCASSGTVIRAAQPVAGARVPIGLERSVTEASLVGAPAQQAYEPLREHFEEAQPLAIRP